jgi:hypothetical protein
MISNRIARIIAACMAATLILTAMFGCSSQNNTAPVVPPPEPVNNPPIISSLTTDQQIAQPLGKVILDCRASDPESDNLSYRWTASGGFIEGSAEKVSWTAPNSPGSYKVTVVVSDGMGGAAAGDAIITVPEKPNNAPVISAIKFTPEGRGTITVKPNPTDKEKEKYPPVEVKYKTSVVECLASDADNDNLTYTWKATGGKIIGSGPKIEWLAAGDAGSYIITCDVSDGMGGTSSLTTSVTVKCCG